MSYNARGQYQAQGRPCEYSDSFVDRVYEYCDQFQTLGEAIPTLEGLCCYIKKTRDTVNRWRKDDDKVDFSSAINYLLNKQSMLLQNSGLMGEFNSKITTLLLSHNHGIRETQSVETTNNINVTSKLDLKEAARMIDFMMTQAKQIEKIEQINDIQFIEHDDGTSTINQTNNQSNKQTNN